MYSLIIDWWQQIIQDGVMSRNNEYIIYLWKVTIYSESPLNQTLSIPKYLYTESGLWTQIYFFLIEITSLNRKPL